jgi:hypothetical protein
MSLDRDLNLIFEKIYFGKQILHIVKLVLWKPTTHLLETTRVCKLSFNQPAPNWHVKLRIRAHRNIREPVRPRTSSPPGLHRSQRSDGSPTALLAVLPRRLPFLIGRSLCFVTCWCHGPRPRNWANGSAASIIPVATPGKIRPGAWVIAGELRGG